MFKTVIVTDLERAFLYIDGSFEKVLTPGKHTFLNWYQTHSAKSYDVTNIHGVEVDKKLKQLLALYPERFEDHLEVVETNEDEVALVYTDEKLIHAIPSNKTVAYWKGVNAPTIKRIDTALEPMVDEKVGEGLARLNFHTLAQHYKVQEKQKLLVTKNGLFESILGAGNYYFWQNDKGYRASLYDVEKVTNHCNNNLVQFAKEHAAEVSPHMHLCETAIDEIALVYQNGVVVDFVPPAKQGIYWKGFNDLTIEKQAVELGGQLSKGLLRQLENNAKGAAHKAVFTYADIETIKEQQVGFLFVNGKLTQQVEAGQYAWWNFDSILEVKRLDLRLQNMEVNGQEILTKDRVNLRINLLADWKIHDPMTVIHELADHKEHLYRELQLALRTVVSTKTLDELLDDKNLLNQDIMAIVAAKVQELGLELRTVGVKDIILPGEMRDILGQVVEAQKMAEANLIKRREETQATRSLHNTAKVMEGNPTLLRLKEFEVLEKITTQIDTLNVYGGLEGVMNNMVNLPQALPNEVQNQAGK